MFPDSDDDALAPASDEAGLAEAHHAAVDFGAVARSSDAAEDALGQDTPPGEGAPAEAVSPVWSDPHPLPAVPAPVIAAPAPPLLPPPPLPKPKPPIRPERVVEDSGEVSYRTDCVHLQRSAGRSWFVSISPQGQPSQRIYVPTHTFDKLLTLSESPAWETGKLWKALCEIPLDRPLPNRRLEEELRALLTAFAGELRK